MKRVALSLSEVAASDIVEQADWYEEQSGQALAKRWEKAVTAAVLKIAGRPRAGSICHFPDAELSDMRRVPVAGFPKHLIFYQLRGTEVLILRVLHGARDLESLF